MVCFEHACVWIAIYVYTVWINGYGLFKRGYELHCLCIYKRFNWMHMSGYGLFRACLGMDCNLSVYCLDELI